MLLSKGALGLVFLVGALTLGANAFPNGGKGKVTQLRGKITVPGVTGSQYPGVYELAVDVENVMFRLLKFQERYRMLRLKIVNRNADPLILSPLEDRVTVQMSDGSELEAILDLSDTEMWEQLGDSARAWLAYPISVEEEENVFLLFDEPDVEGVPVGVTVNLASIAEVHLVDVDAVAN